MKVKVLKVFRDKKEDIIRKKDEIFECSRERFEEIYNKDRNLVEPIEGTEKLKEDTKEGSGSVCDIAHMTEGQLRELAKEKKIKGYTKMSLKQLKEELK